MYNNIAKLLNKEILQRDTTEELSHEKPDPLMVAKKYSDEYISLMCALFSYGNAKLIVKFLNSLDFSLLDNGEDVPKKYYYRFQSNQDVAELFKTTRLLKKLTSIEDKFYEGYSNKNSVMDGLVSIISFMYDLNPYRSRSYEFLLGKIPTHKTNSAYKRWHLYLRWMVRYDNLDMGLWTSVKKEHLLAPLDTHTFKIGQKLGLIKRKTY
nr:TIGR02757 family protein [Sulfurospirillum sp.]